MLNITVQEREYLVELLDETQKELIHEINHTDTHEYRQILRQKLDVFEGLSAKLRVDSEQSRQKPSETAGV